MIKYIVMILALTLAKATIGDEFHTFTSTEGQIVTAKIIAFSSYTGKVQLERENGRKVWVDPGIFTNKDREFIKAWKKKESMPQAPKPKDAQKADSECTEVKELTKTEVRNIAKQYKKAWEDHDYAAWADLLEIHKGHHRLNESAFNNEGVKAIMLRSVDGHNVYVEYNIKLPYNEDTAEAGRVGLIEKRNGWIQVLPDGRIKYTPILFKHPMYDAMDNLYDMFPFRNWGDKLSPQEVSRNINNGTNNLKRMGVPCFGYDLNTSESKRNDAFELILDWMVDHCDNWDETEPKIACPEDMFKAKLERIKRIK